MDGIDNVKFRFLLFLFFRKKNPNWIFYMVHNFGMHFELELYMFNFMDSACGVVAENLKHFCVFSDKVAFIK